MKPNKLKFFLLAATALLPSCLSAQVEMTIDATRRGPTLSPYQYGLFFEEINHAGEGGLYAELVRNRSLEESDQPDYWSAVGGSSIAVSSDSPMNAAQTRYLQLTTTSASSTNLEGVQNEGFWGMKFVADSVYHLSLWLRPSNTGYTGNIKAQLASSDGDTIVAEATLPDTLPVDEWTKVSVDLKAEQDLTGGTLRLLTSNNGTLLMDVVSLFPPTWKGRANGLRPDLAQLLADTHPTFLRFPGGCYVEGMDSYDNAFQWKKTIGPIELRPGHLNKNWGYWSTDGLGFDEYLQLCNDLGAAPLFVVNIGLGHGFEIPVNNLDSLIQNTLDAIEYANGDASTYWGAKRIANGHTEPYGLKFIEIGNENYQADAASSQAYEERYILFYNAIKAKYPDIVTIGNVEAWGTDNPSWRNDYPVELVDEHYYRSPSWMLNQYNKYDSYSRRIGVYVGEYAANASGTYGQYGNLTSALGEAVYMLGMERNSDVVRMASFAPIFTHQSDPTWAYDMIHFDANSHFCTPSYYVQKMLGQAAAQEGEAQNLEWSETGNEATTTTSTQIGVGTWNTLASFDDVTVTDSLGNNLITEDFGSDDSQWASGTGNGTWTITDGVAKETASTTDCTFLNQQKLTTSHYTYQLKARKDDGNEGFLIIFNYQDADNYAWWNIGGWNNTAHGVELCQDGTKTTLASQSGSVETGQWYDIKIQVDGSRVRCYLDDELVHDFNLPSNKRVYQSVQLSGDTMMVKIVNPTDQAVSVKLSLKNMEATSATVTRLTSANGTDENTLDEPDLVVPTEAESCDPTSLDIPAYSLSIYNIKVEDVQPEVADSDPYAEEDSDKYGYLYAHMNASKEITNYALSRYGNSWTDLLGSAEVFSTSDYTTTGGMRDSYVGRLENGQFMLLGTDMTSSLGWTSNHIMDLMLSNDLVHWNKEVKIDLESEENLQALGGITADEMTAAWAPQVIYDPVSKNYMVYYSVGFSSSYHRIYYSMVDENLNILNEPKLLFDPGYDVIDADITYNAIDSTYVMTYKYEGQFHLYQARSKQLVPDDGATGTCGWEIVDGFDVYENGNGIEAPSVWRPIDGNTWKLAYMNYSGGGYRLRDLDEHSLNPGSYTVMQGDVEPQHGSFVKLTEPEYNYLLTWDSVKTLLTQVESEYEITQDATTQQAITLANDALDTDAGSFSANADAMDQALVALQQAAASYKEYLIEQADSGKEVDLTSLLVNPDFSEGSTGWSSSTSFTNADGNVAEFWNKNFDFWQTITGLPNGIYEVGVQSFYRNGTIAAASTAHTLGTEQLLAELYANDTTTAVRSLYSDGSYTLLPYTYPDNVSTANTAFNTNDLYHNTLRVEVTDGTLTIGIRKETEVTSDWCCFDNFTLKFISATTGIQAITSDTSSSSEIYDVTGRKLNAAPEKGIYIQGHKKRMNR